MLALLVDLSAQWSSREPNTTHSDSLGPPNPSAAGRGWGSTSFHISARGAKMALNPFKNLFLPIPVQTHRTALRIAEKGVLTRPQSRKSLNTGILHDIARIHLNTDNNRVISSASFRLISTARFSGSRETRTGSIRGQSPQGQCERARIHTGGRDSAKG